jgi:hypothetical protein
MRTTYRASKVITLVAFLLQHTHCSLSSSIEPVDSRITTGASSIAQVASVVEVENGVLLERGEQA